MKLFLSTIVVFIFVFIAFGQSSTDARFTVFRDTQFPFSISYPDNWTRVEPSAPRMQIKIANNNGKGSAIISISVNYSERNEKISSAEFADDIIAKPELIKSILLRGNSSNEIISIGKTFLDNHEAFFVKSRETYKTFDKVYESIAYQIVMLYEGNAYFLNFGDSTENFDKDFPAFKNIAATFGVRTTKVSTLQPFNPYPDRWHSLIIDVSTPDDALVKLSTPSSDEINNLPVLKVEKWLTDEIKSKKYRILQYDNFEKFDKVVLGFSENKLIFIELHPKNFSPRELSITYGLDFNPALNKFDSAATLHSYLRDRSEVESTVYPSAYYVIGISDRTIITGGIDNNSASDISTKAGTNLSFPGELKQIQIISRTIEK